MQIKLERLPKNLLAATEKMMASGSLAREVLGDDFVEHYGATRVRCFFYTSLRRIRRGLMRF